ncbi:autotransporter domain-containing protein [Bosea sp. UC22_33]|uniref:autotransporter outer membrane beta-barrel domain-containing protein n=1 Tax=Bosea sp. UC22_33 TaxID=3350165 RepID=UPI00367122AD
MKTAPSKRVARSHALRKTSLLSATALVAVGTLSLPSARANSVNYTQSGTYTDAVTVRSTDTIHAAAGITAVFAGTLTYGEPTGGFLFLGDTLPNNGTIVFAPTSILGSPGYSHLGISGGVVRFGSDVARSFYSRSGTHVFVSGGVFDLGGASQTVYRLGQLGINAGTITNNGPGASVLTIANGIDFNGAITDGTNALALRLQGSGTQTLGGNNSYSGGTTLAGGTTLTVKHANALGTGILRFEGLGSTLALDDTISLANDISLASGATAVFSVGSGTGRLMGDISSNEGDLFKEGAGELVLGGAVNASRFFLNRGSLTSGAGSDIADTASVLASQNTTFNVQVNEKIYEVIGTGRVTLADGARLTLGRDQDGGTDYASTSVNAISGAGALRKEGTNHLTLRGANTYSGGTSLAGGTLRAGITGALGAGGLAIDGQGTTLALIDNVRLNNAITLAQGDLNVEVESGTATLGGPIARANPADARDFHKNGPGRLILRGVGSDVSQAHVNSGLLQVDGAITAQTLQVANAAGLSGIGTINANVTIANGGTLHGRSDQALTINGNLVLNSGSTIEVELDAPSTRALFGVGGNLTLDGGLNITGAGNYGAGVYRLFDYDGALTDNGLDVTAEPAGMTATVQTGVARQVNIVVGAGGGPAWQFWDGSQTTANGQVDGGTGNWGSLTNWTGANGQGNAAWGGGYAAFQGTAGTVTVAPGGVSVNGLQFAVNGYSLDGGPITLAAPQTVIRVGDGTNQGTNFVARIGADITGTGGLLKTDLGRLVLTGNNSYQGDTFIQNGTLEGNANSIRNNIVNNGIVVFNQTQDGSFSGNVGGEGGVMIKDGAGTLRLTGRSTLDWSIWGGALSSTTEAFRGNLDIRGAATMRFEQNASGTYGGAVRSSGNGDGRLAIAAGTGNTITFTGDSSGFTGITTVETGALAMNGQLGGRLAISADGRLQGSGTVGDTTVAGTVAPGNSIGTLNVAGNIAFNPGSTYEVEIDAAGASDRIVATGTATINGGSVKVLAGAGNYAPQTQYTILTAAGGRAGTFTGGVSSNLAFLDPALGYDANNVYLTMTRNTLAFSNVGITPNQVAAGGGVESLGQGSPVYNAVLNLSAEQARGAFDQLSGEIHASARTALIEDSRFLRNAVNDRLRAAAGGTGAAGDSVVTYENGKPVAALATTDRLALWGQGFGSWGRTDGDGNAAKLTRRTGGFFIGADAPVFGNWRLGAVAGYSRTDFDVKGRQSSGTSDNYHLGLYGGATWGALALRTGAAYTWHDIATNRTVGFPGLGDRLSGDYGAATAQIFGELAYGFTMGATRIEPFANLAYVNLRTDGFRETGGAAALIGTSADTDATFTTLGLRAQTSFNLGGANLTAKATLGWRHAFGDVTPLASLRFAGGGNGFGIAGVPIARNAAVIEAGLDYAIAPNATLGLSYGGQFGSGLADHSAKANFNVRF